MTNYFKHKLRSKNPAEIAAALIFIPIIIALFIALFALVIMYLWNWLMPEIFGLTTITFWQAIGLGLLAKLLFGTFGSDKSSKKSDKCGSKRSSKKDFSKWQHYDSFWKEEGEKAYNEYLQKQHSSASSETLIEKNKDVL